MNCEILEGGSVRVGDVVALVARSHASTSVKGDAPYNVHVATNHDGGVVAVVTTSGRARVYERRGTDGGLETATARDVEVGCVVNECEFGPREDPYSLVCACGDGTVALVDLDLPAPGAKSSSGKTKSNKKGGKGSSNKTDKTGGVFGATRRVLFLGRDPGTLGDIGHAGACNAVALTPHGWCRMLGGSGCALGMASAPFGGSVASNSVAFAPHSWCRMLGGSGCALGKANAPLRQRGVQCCRAHAA